MLITHGLQDLAKCVHGPEVQRSEVVGKAHISHLLVYIEANSSVYRIVRKAFFFYNAELIED